MRSPRWWCRSATLALSTISLLFSGACLADEPAAPALHEREVAAPGNHSAGAADNAASQAPHGKAGNHLVGQTSPYLLMHAQNPVQWYPWGEEALEKAQRENKLIFLSVGYSSCHWCHVMERESFMDNEIATYLNQHYVSIKVDREQRPDLDAIYMSGLQIFNQVTGSGRSGGWPMSVFLTPDARPFFCGSYFPARDGDRGVATGFLTIVQKIQEVWQQAPEKIEQDAATLTRLVKLELEEPPAVARETARDATLIADVQQALAEQFDPLHGGFGYSRLNPLQPKFPEPSNLYFLLDQIRRTEDEQAEKMLELTLDQMALGGIRDHLAGGFHRYSVDRFWRIPHFEKMLYDNGQLAVIYAEAYDLTSNEEYRQVVEQLLEFVLREMRDEQGGFYAALDAESEGVEGKYYRWTKEELKQLLTQPEWQLLEAVYGLDREPNFEEQYYVLERSGPWSEIAEQMQREETQLQAQIEQIRGKLLAARDERPRPLTDTKVLTAWNGLMIRGLADAGRILEEQRYVEAAEAAADFLLRTLRTDDGRLLRSYSQQTAELNAYLDDYAFLVDGLLALHRATGDERWLDAAQQLTDKQLELFWDERAGGFFYTSDDHESLLARVKDPIDGALPSGNSVSAENLLLLAERLEQPRYRERAEQTIRSSLRRVAAAPAAAPRLAVAAAHWMQDAPAPESGRPAP